MSARPNEVPGHVAEEEQRQYYIVASETTTAQRTRVLKRNDTFALFNEFGDIDALARSDEGLYHAGTRFLSQFTLTLAGHQPLLLSSNVRRDNLLMAVDLTNPDLYYRGKLALPRGAVHINRSKWLWEDVCYERIRVRNFAMSPFEIELHLKFGADFVDIFEVRGEVRQQRGSLLPGRVEVNAAELTYRGLDELLRRTRIECNLPGLFTDAGELRFNFPLDSHGEQVIELAVSCEIGTHRRAIAPHAQAYEQAQRQNGHLELLQCRVNTSHEQFNAWIHSSAADLGMMLTETPHGLYPYAGVPWFDTPFGRDGIITALSTLWLWPDVARGVLSFLAKTQAQETQAQRDCEPGKILHEARHGEMAALGEVPFGRYYGSVDSTPLFVMLAIAFYRRTADLRFIQSIWPNIRAALDWIDNYGDRDADGFIEYVRHSPTGLVQQGWKDSHDSVFHADGTMAEAPIALCEVQGYVYAARLGAAELALALNEHAYAEHLVAQAQGLRERFLAEFWCEDLNTYALALDGNKRPCRVRTSNPGHCLFSGIASEEHARRILADFGQEAFFSGWGVRTVAEQEVRYNPMAYHNGSIWPHDNALLAAGAARYHEKKMAALLLSALFEASTYFDQHRLPELYCGFRRRPGEAPTGYPVACSPQSWACGSVFMMLGACLGLTVDAAHDRVMFSHPVLPHHIDEVSIRNLSVPSGVVDLKLHRYAESVGIDVERRVGRVDVVVQS